MRRPIKLRNCSPVTRQLPAHFRFGSPHDMLLPSTEGVMSKPGWVIAVVALSISSSASLPADIPPSP